MSRSVTAQLKERLKPTPMSELSTPRKLRRAFGFLLAISAGAMAVSANTAYTDWDLRSDGTKGKHNPDDNV